MLKLKGLELLFPNHDVLGSSRWVSGVELIYYQKALAWASNWNIYLPERPKCMIDMRRHCIWVELNIQLDLIILLVGGWNPEVGKSTSSWPTVSCVVWIFFRIREVGVLTTLAEAGAAVISFWFYGCFLTMADWLMRMGGSDKRSY